MRYEDTVRKVCGETWKTVNKREMEGGYGVAIMIAFLRGCRPSITELAQHLEVPPEELVTPYTRLAHSSVFHKDWGARRDRALLGQADSREVHDRAWAHVAGVAGGFLGLVGTDE
jgi:hypothetical protein